MLSLEFKRVIGEGQAQARTRTEATTCTLQHLGPGGCPFDSRCIVIALIYLTNLYIYNIKFNINQGFITTTPYYRCTKQQKTILCWMD